MPVISSIDRRVDRETVHEKICVYYNRLVSMSRTALSQEHSDWGIDLELLGAGLTDANVILTLLLVVFVPFPTIGAFQFNHLRFPVHVLIP